MTCSTIEPDAPSLPADVVSKPEIIESLEESRRRTLGLLAPVPEAAQRDQVSELMSPLCWDLAHIGHFEELWLVRELAGASPTDAAYDDVYDAFKHPRRDRPALDLLDAAGARAFDASVRARTFEVLDSLELAADDPLLADGFVYGMVVQHEHQHDETLLATLQLMDDFVHPAADGTPDAPRAPARVAIPPDVLIPAGEHVLGTDVDPWAYDNERPAHSVELGAYRIDTTAVTNAAYTEFVEAGGYCDRASWSDDGWAWRTDAELVAPQFWSRAADGSWVRRRFGRTEPVPADEPVQHVCWYEADAYARWSGARLPTEPEWEVAAQGTPLAGADLWHEERRFAPAPVGASTAVVSGHGARGMLGGVWEWTASDFLAYPGFRAFPYREYSEAFFGPDYKVLRGGSWATHPSAVRTTFRNWDFPIRRQIFAGFRCARDV
jgi:iron(II)-dependent oxidoreductase